MNKRKFDYSRIFANDNHFFRIPDFSINIGDSSNLECRLTDRDENQVIVETLLVRASPHTWMCAYVPYEKKMCQLKCLHDDRIKLLELGYSNKQNFNIIC